MKKTRNIMTVVAIILWSYIFLVQSCNFVVTTEASETHIEYNGALWVVLDRYTIDKYNSDDKPMKWFRFDKYIKENNGAK